MKSVAELLSYDNYKIIEDLLEDFEMTDNNEKADIIKDLLENELGSNLKEIGCGTNRIAFKCTDDDSIVLKIALDSRGIKDNNLEYQLTKLIDEEDITQCYDNTGIAAVCERVKVMTYDDMAYYKQRVKEKLIKLADRFILNDVGYREFKNWGIRNGEPVILDYAYLRPITPGMRFICEYNDCGGQLTYTKNFKNFKCIKCGCKYSISEIQDDVHTLMDQGLVLSDSYINNKDIDRRKGEN